MNPKIPKRSKSDPGPWMTSMGEVAHPDSPVGGGGPGRFRIASSLGRPGNDSALVPHPQAPSARNSALTDEEQLILLADNSPLPATKTKTVVKPKTVVLNLVGDFENPWKNNPTEESKRIESFKWHPATDSFEAVIGGASTKISGLSNFLGAIKQQKPHTIQRINIFSHGNFGLISFAGRIEKETGDVFLNVSTALDLKITNTEPIPLGNGREQDSMGTVARQLQDRFQEDAQIVLFLCNSGSDPELLQAIANTFHVTVKGFSHQVWVCAEWDKVPGPPKIDRGFTSSNKCKTKQRGFAHLIPDRSAVPK